MVVSMILSAVLVLLAAAGVAQGTSSPGRAGAVGLPGYLVSTADWDPVEEAERLAAVLLEARTVFEVEEALNDILELIGIGVYDLHGTPIRVGNETSAEDFFLYGFETRLLAEGFLAERYLSLEAVVESWRSMGIPIVPLGQSTSELVSTSEVERTLRGIRRTAEENPEHPAGFWIRLFDELGNRERYPFDLLDDDEEPAIEGFARAMQAMLEEQMDVMRREAEAEGDFEMLERLDVLQTEPGQKALLEAMAAGDTLRIMKLFMGEEEIAEVEKALREMEADLREEEEVPEHVRHMVQSVRRFLAGADIDPAELSFEFLHEQMDQLREWHQESLEAHRAAIVESYERARSGSAAEFASAIYRADQAVSSAILELELLEFELGELSDFVEDLEEEYEDNKHNWEEFERRFGLPTFDEEERSPIYLDPIQSLLLHIDMFLEPRTPPEPTGGALESRVQFLKDRLSLVAHAQAPGGGGRSSDAFGWMNDALSTGRSIRSVINDVKNIGMERSYKGAAGAIVRGTVQTAATELHLEVFYRDDGTSRPGAPQDPRASIHLRHGERLDEKEIQIQARLSSPFLDALSDALSQIDPGLAYGPVWDLLGTSDSVAEALDDLYSLADWDLDEVPVRFQPDSEFFGTFLEPTTRWDSVRGLTFTQKTGSDRIADGFFYLKREEPDIGGWTEVVPGLVRVQAMVNASSAAMYNPARWGLAVGEEIFRPVEADINVQVERHIPVPRFGSLTFSRTVTEVGGTDAQDEVSRSMFSRHASATLTIELTRLRMDEGGALSADYSAKLTGDWQENDHQAYLVECDECGPNWDNTKTVTTTGTLVGTARGRTGEIMFMVDSRADTYVVWPGPLLGKSLLEMEVVGDKRITTIEKSCCDDEDDDSEPEDDENDDSERKTESESVTKADMEAFVTTHMFNSARIYVLDRPHFPRTVELRDSARWTRVYPDPRMAVYLGAPSPDFTYYITTHVRWNLGRLGDQ